jgi:death-on-curing protein
VVDFLELADVLKIHADQIERYGGLTSLRDSGLLEAAIAMPKQAFGGVMLHPDVPSMAAAYLFHLVRNHPFTDGNKRTGAAASNVFLRLNNWRLNCSEDEFYEITIKTAEGSAEKDQVTQFFRTHAEPLPSAEKPDT